MPSAKFKKTRFDDGEQRLLYGHVEVVQCGREQPSREVSFWSFFSQLHDEAPRRVGPAYSSEQELLADMARYAADYGFDKHYFAPSVQDMGYRSTSFGGTQYIRIYTPDYRQLSWEEVWGVFVDRFPDKWAVQFFPPKDQVVNETNIYHLYVLEERPKGVNINRSGPVF